MSIETQKSIDDEYTPGVFQVFRHFHPCLGLNIPLFHAFSHCVYSLVRNVSTDTYIPFTKYNVYFILHIIFIFIYMTGISFAKLKTEIYFLYVVVSFRLNY